MDHANLKELRAIDFDSSDNLTEEMLQKFLSVYGPQLQGKNVVQCTSYIACITNFPGICLAGMNHVTDTLWISVLPLLKASKILVLGSSHRMAVKIHVDHLIDAIARYGKAM